MAWHRVVQWFLGGFCSPAPAPHRSSHGPLPGVDKKHAALATCEYTGQDEFDGEIEFLGRRLPYSHDRPMATLGKLAAAGLVVISTRLI